MEQVVKAQEMNSEEIGAVAGGVSLPASVIIGSILGRSGCPTCSRVSFLPTNYGVDPAVIG